MKQRARVVGGLLVAAALVGLGIYPVRKGLTLRYAPTAAQKSTRRSRPRRSWKKLLFWW